MITVRICHFFFEEFLRGGSQIGPYFIERGLPPGAAFLNIRYDHDRDVIVAEFVDPQPGPDREIEVLVTRGYNPRCSHPLLEVDERLKRYGRDS